MIGGIVQVSSNPYTIIIIIIILSSDLSMAPSPSLMHCYQPPNLRLAPFLPNIFLFQTAL
jgi:hypothetical protein